MRPGHFRERPYGMRYYRSGSPGIGGRLRATPEDFRVVERRSTDPEPLDADPGDFGHLLVEVTLRDWDTHAFVSALAGRLGIDPERIAWAGTKDATAVTTQLVSIAGIEPGALPDLPDVDLEPVGRLGRALSFGDHGGNRFEIVVRGATADGRIERITADLGDQGTGEVTVPNWFGPQRFGVRRPVTHQVGLALVRGDPRFAVMTYLGSSSPHEPPPTRAFRSYVTRVAAPENRWSEALDRTPGYLQHERTMVGVLADAGRADDRTCRRALDALPWSLRRLFVHALQSALFNEVVSERVRRDLPLARPVVGDVVCLVDDDGGLMVDRPQPVTEARLTAAERHCRRGRAAVTAPLLGTETTLAEGEPGAIERAVLEGYDLASRDFADVLGSPETGSRRTIALETTVTVEGEPPRFGFELSPGSYATVVMREYLKTDPLRTIELPEGRQG